MTIIYLVAENCMYIKRCDSRGRAAASDTRGLRFECSFWQFMVTVKCIEKMPEMAQFKQFFIDGTVHIEREWTNFTR